MEEGISLSADGQSLLKDGVEYNVGDHVYVHPETFDQLEQSALAEVPDYAAKGRFHKVFVLFMGTPLQFFAGLCVCTDCTALMQILRAGAFLARCKRTCLTCMTMCY